MASDVSRDDYKFLLAQDPRIELWDAESSYTQAGPRPGVPVPQNDGMQLQLTSSGTQSASGSLDVEVQRGGFAGPGRLQLRWKNSADASTGWRGWDPPCLMTAWEAITFSDSLSKLYPHAVTLKYQTDRTKNGIVVMVYDFVSGSNAKVGLRTRSLAGTWSSETSPYSETVTAGGSDFLYPSLVELPSGRLLLFHWMYDDDASTAQIGVEYSDDQGATWSTHAHHVLPADLDISTVPVNRARAAYRAGQICLVAWTTEASGTTRERLRQYASSDLGASFVLIDAWDGTSGEIGGLPDLVVSGGYFVLVYCSTDTNSAARRRITSAYTPFVYDTETKLDTSIEAAVTTDANGVITEGEMAVCADEDGTLYALFQCPTVTGDPCVVFRSEDDGGTWAAMSDSGIVSIGGVWFTSGDASTHPVNFSAIAQRGRVLVLHNWVADPGDEDNSLGCAYLGGHTNITMPGNTKFRKAAKRVSWLFNWLPYDEPDDCGWTASTSGTPTTGLANGRLELSTDASNWIQYQRNPTGTIAEGAIIEADFEVTSGQTFVLIRMADSTDDYQLRVVLSTTTLSSRDDNAASEIDSALVGSGPLQVKIAIQGSAASVWYRDMDTDEDREWTNLTNNATLTSDTSTPDSNNLLVFGHSGTRSGDSYWYRVAYVSDEYTGEHGQGAGFTNPDDLFGREISGRGRTYMSDGVYVSATGGPAFADDAWAIDVRYDYPGSATLTDSPRETWRSTENTGQDWEIAYKISDIGDAYLHNDMLGIALLNINFSAVTIQGYDNDTSSWVTITGSEQISTIGTFGLAYTRYGNTVRCSGSSQYSPTFYADELAGWTWAYTDNNSSSRRILSNNTGKWTTSTTKPATIMLEDAESGDPSSGVLLSGTAATVVPKDAVFLFPLSGAIYSGYKIIVEDPASGSRTYPAESYMEIGRVIIGSPVILGQRWSWGRTLDVDVQTELREARDGTITSRVTQPRRRSLRLGFTDGISTKNAIALDGESDDDYVYVDTGSEPAALHTTVPFDIDGLIETLKGAHRPLIVGHHVDKSTADQQVFNRRQHFMYARLVSGGVAIESAFGDEFDDEVFRIGPLEFREEV